MLGTAAYLAPEQARGEEAGPRADIYSLGVVAYQLLSGRLPYEATSLSELALKQQRESPIPLDELNPRVPRELAQAVAMALAIDQEARPPDAIVFAEALRNGAHGIAPLPEQRADGAPRHRAPRPECCRPVATSRPRRRASHLATNAPRTQAPRTQAPRPQTPRATRPAAVAPCSPARARPATTARTRRRQRPRRKALRRFIAFVALALTFTAAVAIAVVLANEHVLERGPVPQGRRDRRPERDQPDPRPHQPA